MHEPLHVINFEPWQVQTDLKYEEKSVQILDQKVQKNEDKDDTTSKGSMAEPWNRKSFLGVRTRNEKQIPVSIPMSHFEVGMYNTFVIYDLVFIIFVDYTVVIVFNIVCK